MKISVAISAFEAQGRGQEFIAWSLGKLSGQVLPPGDSLEVVVSDHSADDAVRRAVAEFADRLTVTYVRNERDRGNMSANINNAIAHCTGDVVKILFQDDYLEGQGALAALVKPFDDPRCVWSVSTYDHTHDRVTRSARHHPTFDGDLMRLATGFNGIGSPSCVAFRRLAVDQAFDPEVNYFMDCEWYARMLHRYGPPTVVRDTHVVTLFHPQQMTHSVNSDGQVALESAYVRTKHEGMESSAGRSTAFQ